tara:strand:+ start:3179 stop:4120 length:942 start_codon:yes stop_codon:yes gene_type:complete
MADRAEAFRSGRFYLPTVNLTDVTSSFGSVVPAVNNNYDVFINFSQTPELKAFINQHGFFDINGNSNPGSYLALFCSEAVLPGSDLQAGKVDGLRQGLSQNYATFRRFPDVILTFYSQTDYFTNEAFNAWLEFISPTRIGNGSFGQNTDERVTDARGGAFRRMKYPSTYKCNMEITAFSKETTDEFGKLNKTTKFGVKLPSSITYHIMNAFPTSIVSAPLAYGRAELIKTTITFNYEQYFTQRTSRKGAVFAESDMDGHVRNPDFVENNTDNTSNDNLESTIKKINKKKSKNEKPFTREQILGTQNPFVREGF